MHTSICITGVSEGKERRGKKKYLKREFPSGPVVRTPRAFTAVSPGSIPGWGTKIPQAVRYDQKKKKKFEEIIAKNFPNLMKDTTTHIQETQ